MAPHTNMTGRKRAWVVVLTIRAKAQFALGLGLFSAASAASR